tara:strand:+ start:224 stop:685 length:462 start_codon:yes stop_codon:yes gene_type:complete
MANPMYGQNKDDSVLSDVAEGKLTVKAVSLPLANDVSVTADDSGQIIFVDATGASGEVDIALPSPAKGLYFRFITTEDTPTQDVKIVATGAIVYGILQIQSDTNEDNSVVAAGSTNVLIKQAAKKGDWIEYISDGTSWFIRGMGTVQAAFTVS